MIKKMLLVTVESGKGMNVANALYRVDGVQGQSSGEDFTEFEVEISAAFDGQDEAFERIEAAIRDIPGVLEIKTISGPTPDDLDLSSE